MRKIIYILAARLRDREIAGTLNESKSRSLETPKPRVQSFCNLILTTYLNLEFLNYKFSEYGKSRPKTAFYRKSAGLDYSAASSSATTPRAVLTATITV